MDEIFWSSGYIKMEMGLSLNALIHRRNSAVVAVGGPFDGSPLFHKSNSKFQNSRDADPMDCQLWGYLSACEGNSNTTPSLSTGNRRTPRSATLFLTSGFLMIGLELSLLGIAC
ncbi:hypothetical protein SDJN03_07642, partial [Cucurbita argyrosperma subsp. sororia]